ncbi:MAG: glycosyltransferase [Anaerolineae bacterium]
MTTNQPKSRPLRVLYLIDSFQMGGAERITAAFLPHFDPAQVEPILCTLNLRKESPLIEQVRAFPRFNLRAKRLLDPLAFARLIGVLRRERIDLIHAQLQDATVFATLAHVITRIPVVITRHVMVDDETNWRRSRRSQLERWAVRTSAARVISVSKAAGERYREMVGLPAERFETIYNGIDLERFGGGEKAADLRARLGLPTGVPLVTMVGVLRAGKGQDVCIEAARSLPGVHFALVGDGELRTDLEAQAADLRDRVHFLGQRMDIPDILRASDGFVLPSDNEALPTVVIEAGAAGLPVIASQVGGIPEIIEEGVSGLLIPVRRPDLLAEKIRWVLDHPDEGKRLGETASQRIRSIFSLPAQTAALTHLYRQVTKR